MLLRETGGPCTSMRCMTERCQAGSMTFKACAVQALECNAQGRKVARGKKKGRRTALYFRLIRPASGLHAHDMQAQGMAPSWRDAVSRLLQEHSIISALYHGHCLTMCVRDHTLPATWAHGSKSQRGSRVYCCMHAETLALA